MEKELVKVLRQIVDSYVNSRMIDLKRFVWDATELLADYDKEAEKPVIGNVPDPNPMPDEIKDKDVAYPQQDEVIEEEFLTDEPAEQDD